MSEEIQIIHTNDLHSHFENFPKIERFIQQQRIAAKQAGQTMLLFDLGDASDRQHPLTEATKAQANIQWMNQLHYDGVTIGNSEGLYYRHQDLEHMYDQANFDVILGNLKEKNGLPPAFLQNYKILQTQEQTKIGVLGLTAPYTLTYPLAGWQIQMVDQVLPNLIQTVRPQVDVLILLSHLGLPTDQRLARQYPQLDLIIGSHTHHLLPQGQLIGHTLLTAAGKYGQHIGTITLTLTDHQLIKQQAQTVAVAQLPSQAADQGVITKYETKGHQLLRQQKIANLPFTLTQDPFADQAALKLTLQALLERTQVPAAMLNSGLFLTDLSAGVITADDLHRQLPHAIHLMITKLKGRDFWRFIMEVEKNRNFLRNFHQKGMGFRGKIFGEIFFSGVEFDKTTQRVFYCGQEIQPQKDYQIALLDHYLFIPFFPTLQIVGQNTILYPDFLREVLGKYLQQKFPLIKEGD